MNISGNNPYGAGSNADTPAVDIAAPVSGGWDVAEIMGGLYGDGFIGLKGAFSRDWEEQLHEDVLALYKEA